MSGLAILEYVSMFSAAFPLAAAIWNYKYLDVTLKTVALFFLISALFDITLVLLYSCFAVKNTALVVHIFIWVSIIFFARIYYMAFSNPLLKKLSVLLPAIVLAIVVFNAIAMEGIKVYPSVSNTILGIMMIFFSLSYFYQLFDEQEFVYIEKQGLFWVNSGVLIYFSINIFLFMLINRISPEDVKHYWAIHSVINTIANLSYAIGLSCKPQNIT